MLNHKDLVLELEGRVHWQDFVKSKDDILIFIDKLEERTGLKLMARFEGDKVDGFVTGPFVVNDKRGFIVSLYEEPLEDLEERIYGSTI